MGSLMPKKTWRRCFQMRNESDIQLEETETGSARSAQSSRSAQEPQQIILEATTETFTKAATGLLAYPRSFGFGAGEEMVSLGPGLNIPSFFSQLLNPGFNCLSTNGE